MNRCRTLPLLALAALLLARPAAAATTCQLNVAGGLAFGNYDVLSPAPNDSLAMVNAVCTRDGGPQNVTISVQLSPGANGSSVNDRRMRNIDPQGGYLSYNLFRDVGRNAVWGFSPNVDAMTTVLSVPNKSSSTATFTIYGRIPALQDVPVGSYTDSVTVTVTP